MPLVAVSSHTRASEGRRLAQRAIWSQTAVFSKTARSVALRGGLIEGHTGVRQTRMPVVGKWDVRFTRTAATTRQGRSAAPFFRADGIGSRSEMPSLRQ